MKINDIARLVIFGCSHVGSKSANIQSLWDYANVLKEPNTWGLSLGDLFENAITARGEGMMNDQHLTPDEQIDEVVRIFRPVANKFLGAVTSNHSRRTYKEVGIDMDRRLWRELGYEHTYKGLQGTIAFKGKTIAFAHGAGSGDNWSDAIKLFKIYPGVDIVCVSHRHEMTMKWHGSFKVDLQGHKVKKYCLFVRTGGLMDYPKYAQEALYSPQKPGFSQLFFLPDGKVRVDPNGL